MLPKIVSQLTSIEPAGRYRPPYSGPHIGSRPLTTLTLIVTGAVAALFPTAAATPRIHSTAPCSAGYVTASLSRGSSAFMRASSARSAASSITPTSSTAPRQGT
jgi:hypothetical protein